MEVIARPAIAVVGIQIEIDVDDRGPAVDAAWAELFDRADAIIGRTGTVYLELSTDLGDGRHQVLVGAQVDAGTPAPAGMVAELIYEASWIHELHQAALDSIGHTFRAMLDFAADTGIHTDGVRLDVGYGADQPHDLYLRLTP